MTAQPEHRRGPVPAIPRTMAAIGDALSAEKRLAFFAEVLAAEAGDVADVMYRWWKVAMLDRVPGVETSRANVAAGRHLVAVAELADRLGA